MVLARGKNQKIDLIKTRKKISWVSKIKDEILYNMK